MLFIHFFFLLDAHFPASQSQVLYVSVQFSRSVVSNSLWPHESQHARPPCPSPSPGVHSNLRPSSWWCHPAISSSVVPFSSCPQSLPASESFPMFLYVSRPCYSEGVSIKLNDPLKTTDNSTSEYLLEGKENTNSKRYLCPHILCSIIYNSQDMEIT